MNIELYKAGMKYKDSQIFSDLSFLAGAGDRLALVSSDYKSLTMTLQAMLGMRRLCSGWASIDGEPVLPSVAACYRRYISYLPNNIDFEDITLEQLANTRRKKPSVICSFSVWKRIACTEPLPRLMHPRLSVPLLPLRLWTVGR